MRVSKSPRQRRGELIAAARILFDEQGVDNTRVSDIVAQVGVAQGVFYYYFKSKDEMVAEVARQVGEEINRKASFIIKGADNDFCQKLSGLIELYLDLVDQFLEDGAARLPPNSEKAFGPAAQSVALLSEHLLALITQGQATGQVHTPFPWETVQVLLHGFKGAAQTALPSKEMVYAITQQALGIENDRLMQVYHGLSNIEGAQRDNTNKGE